MRMRGWSIPLGRWMGVELRVHTFFLLLAVVCLGLAASDGIGRGIVLFMTLVLAVVVREIARLLVAAWLGLRLRAILLLPIGGMFANKWRPRAPGSLCWRLQALWPMASRR